MECIHLHKIATPREPLRAGKKFNSSKIDNRPGRTVLTRNPFGKNHRDRPGFDCDLFLRMQNFLSGMRRIHNQLDGLRGCGG